MVYGLNHGIILSKQIKIKKLKDSIQNSTKETEEEYKHCISTQ